MSPARVVVFQNRYLLGGQERQALHHLATLDRARFEPLAVCLKREGELLADLSRLGLAPRSLEVAKTLRPGTLWKVARLAAWLRRERVALVHAQDFYTDLLGTAAARLAGVPVVVTRVDLMHHLDAPRRRALGLVSRLADAVSVNARAVRDLCLADGVAPERIALVRNGVDLAAFHAAAPEPATVVHVANMHHEVKGQDDLLRAFAEVARELPAARLLLVGDGARRPALERLARELGVAGRAEFLGHRRDVPALLGRASVVASASRAEGLSNAILEGMAARRPVVATAVGGTPELVRDGETGFLVPPRAPPLLAARLLRLLRDPALARRMGEGGRAVAERDFSLDAMRRGYEALYAAALARGAAAARLGGAPSRAAL